jgi:hypothetical protein
MPRLNLLISLMADSSYTYFADTSRSNCTSCSSDNQDRRPRSHAAVAAVVRTESPAEWNELSATFAPQPVHFATENSSSITAQTGSMALIPCVVNNIGDGVVRPPSHISFIVPYLLSDPKYANNVRVSFYLCKRNSDQRGKFYISFYFSIIFLEFLAFPVPPEGLTLESKCTLA